MSIKRNIEKIATWNQYNFKPLFNTTSINTNLYEKGYDLIDLNIDTSHLNSLIKDSDLILNKIDSPPDHFYNFGQLNNFELRNLSYQSIQNNLLPSIQKIINDQTSLMAGTHLVKPPGNNSYFSAHQDNNMIDERYNRSYSFWIPLQDITHENGAFYVMEKSHLFGNIFRSLSIPWVFKNVVDSIKLYSVPLYPRKGQAIIFDASLIHFTGGNLSNFARIAINVLVIPKKAELIKCIYKKFRLFNDIDIYKIDMNYYLNEECEKKPSNKYAKITEVKSNLPILNNTQFNDILKHFS